MASASPARQDPLATLGDWGLRLTGPRRSVIGLLAAKDGGFSAEQICAELPDVGRATVYRTIKLLVDAGLLCHVALPDGATRYSLSRVEHHHHTVCVRCGTVGEFSGATMEQVLRAAGASISGELIGHRIEFYIVCRECLPDSQGQPGSQRTRTK
jgi:Fe2+ or Zn2+ uptake regulation protein